jgi:hypothetical protein
MKHYHFQSEGEFLLENKLICQQENATLYTLGDFWPRKSPNLNVLQLYKVKILDLLAKYQQKLFVYWIQYHLFVIDENFEQDKHFY